MRTVLDFIVALGVPILEVRWWERSSILTKANIDAAGLNQDFILAQHITPAGFIPVLLWYGQYFWGENFPVGQILHLPAETGWWRLNVGGEPPDEQLNMLPDIRKPWSPGMGSERPCFWMGPVSATKPITELIVHPVLDLNGDDDYAVGGFISGFDFPKNYLTVELDRLNRDTE